jgi:hypothetical protein
VLVGALVLAFVITAATVLRGPTQPLPSPIGTITRPIPTPAATPFAGPVFEAPSVVSVGLVSRGSTSRPTLELEFVESRPDAIPDGPGSFRVTLKDQAGDESTVGFIGEPLVAAPGSLGATASLVAPNVLMVNIVASDRLNIEPITITGLAIRTTDTAALGPMIGEVGDFDGSLASGATGDTLPSPGSVIALP